MLVAVLDEEPLAGGNMNAVVRAGGAVLRRSGPWTPTVHRLLAHLRARGFDAAPQPLGVRADKREALSYLPGDVPVYPLPGYVWTEEVLVQAGTMLRQWHDATTDFDGADAVWQQPAHRPAEVICHNDFSPHNLVFTDGRVTGVIDVDMASPGPRTWDLAYLATRLVPLSTDHPSWPEPKDARGRLAVLLTSYGFDGALDDLLDTVTVRLLDLADFSDRAAVDLGRPDLHEHAAYYRDEAAWFERELRPRLTR